MHLGIFKGGERKWREPRRRIRGAALIVRLMSRTQ